MDVYSIGKDCGLVFIVPENTNQSVSQSIIQRTEGKMHELMPHLGKLKALGGFPRSTICTHSQALSSPLHTEDSPMQSVSTNNITTMQNT